MTARPMSPPEASALLWARLRPYLRPRPRWRELSLLGLVGLTLWVGSLTLGTTLNVQAATLAAGQPPPSLDGLIAASRPELLAIYLLALLGAHLALVVVGRRTDQILLPTIGLLGGLSLLLMERLPQDLAGRLGGLAQTQLVWLVLGLAAMTAAGVAIRGDAWLRRYKYTWAAVGVGLLLLTFVLGREVNGQRLTLQIGPFSGQPTELLKVILVVFLAGYLSENRPLLVEQSTRVGPFRLPPVPYLVPMVAMWAIALGVVIVQRDLGAALLLFAVFLLLLYVATARWGYVVLGIAAFIAGGGLLYAAFGHVRTRVDIWLDPFSRAQEAGYQVVQALHAFARGGILGSGLGGGLPTIGTSLPGGIPEIHTDFPFAALGEELGLIGVLAVLGLYLVLIERGLRIAASAPDEYRAILAAGLSLVVGVQAFIIAAGNLKLIPLTGITLPFISYGGSSLLANGLIVGVLLALSDRGVGAPPAPRRNTS
ncbi:MAG TPA: FtsW/RodA/SpoVE family cell cycle protein [Candidatus Polarisedimenticolia bacterium]|nr:FtsW/RodA/SpoVE family cell cycle protein [Candidatus Polarisedimenticolia bacterium]